MPAKKNPKKTDPMLGALAASFGPSKAATLAAKDLESNQPTDRAEGEGIESKEISPSTKAAAVEPTISAPTAPPPQEAPEIHPPAIAKNRAESGGVKKTTVSFHDAEQDQVDLILDALKRCRRHRGGFSDAIKIALRLCPLDEVSIGRAWDEARAQDQRVLRHRRNS